MGATQAERDTLFQTWKAAKADVDSKQNGLQAAINILKRAGGTVEAQKIEQSFRAFQSAVEQMRQEVISASDLLNKSKDAIKAELTEGLTQALGKIESAQNDALDAIKKAKKEAIDRINKTGKEIEEKLKGKTIEDIIASMDISDADVLYRNKEFGEFYKISKEGKSSPLLPPLKVDEHRGGVSIYSYSWLKDHLLVNASDNTGEEWFILRKSDKAVSSFKEYVMMATMFPNCNMQVAMRIFWINLHQTNRFSNVFGLS